MDELIQKLEQLKQEKDEKIIPENIREGVTIFGITGTYNGNENN